MEIIDLKKIIKEDSKNENINEYGEFCYYELLEAKVYPWKLLDKWSYIIEQVEKRKVDLIIREEYITLKIFDEESFYGLYCEPFNPVTLRTQCLTGAKLEYNIENELVYDFQAMIRSIDDSSYGTIFSKRSLKEIDDIRNKFFNYLEEKKIINNEEFVKFGESIGGENNSW